VSDPSPVDVAVQRRRLRRMIAIDAVCVLVAGGAIAGDAGFHVGWLIWVFVGALLVGFGAQIWLVMGLIPRR
jgi:hypothetical protein